MLQDPRDLAFAIGDAPLLEKKARDPRAGPDFAPETVRLRAVPKAIGDQGSLPGEQLPSGPRAEACRERTPGPVAAGAFGAYPASNWLREIDPLFHVSYLTGIEKRRPELGEPAAVASIPRGIELFLDRPEPVETGECELRARHLLDPPAPGPHLLHQRRIDAWAAGAALGLGVLVEQTVGDEGDSGHGGSLPTGFA